MICLYIPASLSQCLDRKVGDEDGGVEGSNCLAYRTRSKRPLVNVPLGQLEAELLAPDITADMYEQGAAQREEDRHWTKWLQGLMAPEDEGQGSDWETWAVVPPYWYRVSQRCIRVHLVKLDEKS